MLYLCATLAVAWLVPTDLFPQQNQAPTAQTADQKKTEQKNATPPPSQILEHAPFETFKRRSLITQAVALSILALLPFIIMLLTSFLKIVIVLSLLRSALGVQQAPPNQVINGVGFMLSMYIMYPTVLAMYNEAQSAINEYTAPDSLFTTESSQSSSTLLDALVSLSDSF